MKTMFRNVEDYGLYYHGVILHELEGGRAYRVGWYYSNGNNGYKVFKCLARASQLYLQHERNMIESGLISPKNYRENPL